MLPLLSEIGKRRKVLGLTQQGFAKEAGVNRSLLAKVESGHANPSYGEAKKMFETLERLESRMPQWLASMELASLHNTNIMYAEADEPLYLIEKKMAKMAYSQLPVRRNGQIIGSLTERGMNRALLGNKGGSPKTLLVEDAMEEVFPLVPVSTKASAIAPLLQTCQGVLTIDEGKVVGILTNADLIKLFRMVQILKL
jgi:predicted transcriptional regulator